MAYAPDYGLAMLKSGMDEASTISFSPFNLTNISMLGDGDFTTSVNVPIGEVEHALSVDFSPAMLGNILSLGPDDTAKLVLDWLKRTPAVATFELASPIAFDVLLVFGEPQSNDDEVYVPLVVQEVLPPYGLLERYEDEGGK